MKIFLFFLEGNKKTGSVGLAETQVFFFFFFFFRPYAYATKRFGKRDEVTLG